MRILLAYRCQYGGRNDFYTRQMPVGLGSINAVLRTEGHDARLANFSRSTWEEVRRTLRRFRPRILGISLFTFNRGAVLRLARVARQIDPGIFIVAGGPHATHLAEHVLSHHPSVNAVAIGEGEETMRDLARALEAGEDLRRIAGLAFREGGRIVRTSPRPAVSDLDLLPHPAAHYESFGVDRFAQFEFLITSRGCPARCTFCSTPEFWGTRLRYRSVDHVLDELRFLQERFGHTTVSFRDDTFTVDKKRTIELCQRILASGLHLLWDCQSRVNAIDEERLLWMRRAGCQHIQYGVESGSRSILDKLNKGIQLEQVIRACALTRKVGMDLSLYLITGVQGESEEDTQATLRLIRRVRPHDGIVSPLVVYPGTALYEEAKQLRGVDDSVWERSRMEGLLVRDDPESILAYHRVDSLLKEVAVSSVYTLQERREHKRVVGESVAPTLSCGETLEGLGDRSGAEAEYLELLETHPGSLWGHLRLGNLAEMAGNSSAAADHYRQAVAAVPRYHLAHSLFGSALRRMEKRSEALAEFRAALKLYPNDRIARRGMALLRRGRAAGAKSFPSLRKKPSTGLTGSSTWPSFLRHPIPDGQSRPPEAGSGG
ncbi:MAG: radical SAM protein [Acidobacteria bacterium]|nr:radical SAM protein [Acidobacteriota bacterium]MCI0566832.1 radical SAM protein [Acidobacteriota bacterium]